MSISRQRRIRRSDTGGDGVVARRHNPDYQIALFTGLLMLLGLIVMYSIGPERANVLNNELGTNYYSNTYFFVKQLISLLLASVAFVALAVLPYTLLKKYADKILIVALGACVLLFLAGNVLHSGIAQCSLGACRWFNVGPLGTIQPAELLKLGLLLFVAGFLATRIRQNLVNDLHKTLIPLGVLILVVAFLIIGLQKDMGTGIAIIAIIASIVAVSGVTRKIGAILLGAALAVGVIFIIIAPYRIERILTILRGDDSSSQNATTSDYQVENAKIAIGSGGLLGVGIGNSVEASGYLPEAINDSVFAIMGETFGFVGLLVILGLFTTLLLRLLKIADGLPDTWMKLVVVGIFGWLAAHVILNVAAMIGIFPLTGITLPLLSFGGTSMIFIAGALGLAFQLSRYTVHRSLNKENNYENTGSRRGIGRARYTSSRGSS